MDKNDLTLITKGIKKFLVNERRFRRGRPSNNNNNQFFNPSKGKGKQEVTKKQHKKCYEYGQPEHYISECLMKKEMEIRGERRQTSKNFKFHGMIAIQMVKLKKKWKRLNGIYGHWT